MVVEHPTRSGIWSEEWTRRTGWHSISFNTANMDAKYFNEHRNQGSMNFRSNDEAFMKKLQESREDSRLKLVDVKGKMDLSKWRSTMWSPSVANLCSEALRYGNSTKVHPRSNVRSVRIATGRVMRLKGLKRIQRVIVSQFTKRDSRMKSYEEHSRTKLKRSRHGGR